MAATVYSIGHSTHAIGEFIELLKRHDVAVLADIRRFPGSRRYPQFNQDALAQSLNDAGIEYRWFEALGGRRGKSKQAASTNLGLRNESFRNYADYMQTDAFRTALEPLLEIAASKPTALMCSEGLYWKCHRRLVSDYLLMLGITVQHILPNGDLKPHAATPEARFDGGVVRYAAPGDAERLLF
jgi:uncharacterized protein (DUF488 family)